MQPLVLLTEVAGLSVLVCVLHSLRHRLGLAPLYVALGLFEAFLFVAGKSEPAITAALFGVPAAKVSYALFLPLILTGGVLVYILEGTREARRLLAALVGVYILHGAIDVIIEYHASHPPPGHANLGGHDLVWYSMEARFASLLAMVVDYLVIIIGYQFLRNRLSKLPLMVPIGLATVAALICDSVIFRLVRGGLSGESLFLLEKLQTGLAAAIPAWLYLAWLLHRHKDDIRHGILQREPFQLLWLRQRVQQVEDELALQRSQYAYVRDTFSRYVSSDVVDAIEADPSKVKLGGEERHVTVLFADIRGYSTLSESLGPTEVVTILNRYFQQVSDIILAHGGMINEFEGDAVLAVFGAPLDLEHHAERAVQAALEMLDAVDELNAAWDRDGTSDKWKRLGIDRFAIRVGIHSGPVVAGNIGSTTRIKYAVIGDTVNTASRVEELCKKLSTSLLFTGATLKLMESGGAKLDCADLGERAVAGRNEPVHVFTVQASVPQLRAPTPSESGAQGPPSGPASASSEPQGG